MAVPDAVDFPGADESAFDAGVGQQLRVTAGDVQALAEDLRGDIGSVGRGLFHVKHPFADTRTTRM